MNVAEGLAMQRARIGRACGRAGRDPGSVQLVAVSKGHPASACAAAIDAGHTVLGESYVQEWTAKRAEVTGAAWHFIGQLQTNKARAVAGQVAWIHGVDRPSLVDALGRLQVRQPILIQVNVGDEATKGGCAPADAAALVSRALAYPTLVVGGLMAVPPPVEDPEQARPWFRALRALHETIRDELTGAAAASFCELSMGMSDDLEVAVEEGATMVRVGTAIFGERRKA